MAVDTAVVTVVAVVGVADAVGALGVSAVKYIGISIKGGNIMSSHNHRHHNHGKQHRCCCCCCCCYYYGCRYWCWQKWWFLQQGALAGMIDPEDFDAFIEEE
ncbi:hypothetical protein CLNEO_16450 [Anaerotignum neopropionicum]|uniref:Uncharacterized protein n=1 Tax=Anaerotignum neopropionicum TaxID=36847 RepID=A0A136WEX8_9FIRM|nr:hypothetical protein [Anaerotignum neopropionicum]KXL53102.1 hypothetical protein CLNEO_16450 [Anaerotignum neopropionicum]